MGPIGRTAEDHEVGVLGDDRVDQVDPLEVRELGVGFVPGKQEINHKEINYNGPKEAPISTM